MLALNSSLYLSEFYKIWLNMSIHIQMNQNRSVISLWYNRNIRLKISGKISGKFFGKLPTGIFTQLFEATFDKENSFAQISVDFVRSICKIN